MRTLRPMTMILAAAAMLLAAAPAFAQPVAPRGAPMPGYATPGYGPPPPPPVYHGGFFHRRGLTLGLSLGAGAMDSDTSALDCFDCTGEPLAGGFSFHIGGMLSPRLALLFEAMLVTKAIDSSGYNRVDQSMALIAGQYWVTPRAWIKGGVGAGHVSLTYDDGFVVVDEPVADGGALMAAAGYEVVTRPHFAIDIELRGAVGMYEGVTTSHQVQSLTIGAGFSWF